MYVNIKLLCPIMKTLTNNADEYIVEVIGWQGILQFTMSKYTGYGFLFNQKLPVRFSCLVIAALGCAGHSAEQLLAHPYLALGGSLQYLCFNCQLEQKKITFFYWF
jgi:hypothetical protein